MMLLLMQSTASQMAENHLHAAVPISTVGTEESNFLRASLI
jgi:hypothetical protein